MKPHNWNAFHSIDDIDACDGINGLTIEEIERRAAPLPDKTQDSSWKCRSYEGFIGHGESFKELIKRDWQTVEQLRTTHQEIANNLKRLIDLVEETRNNENYGPMRAVTLQFLPSFANYNVEPQTLVVEHFIYNGYQQSLFYNENESSNLNTMWNEDYLITNEALSLSIKIAGNTSQGIIKYIENFGFYEGGAPGNTYRIEPPLLLFTLTGITNSLCWPLIHERVQFQIDELHKELDSEITTVQEKTLSNNISEEDSLAWIQQRRIHYQNLTNQLEEYRHKLYTSCFKAK
jgi:hypothetical protein